MSSVDVLVQRMADGLHTESSCLKIRFFRPMFSNTASTICPCQHTSSSRKTDRREHAATGGGVSGVVRTSVVEKGEPQTPADSLIKNNRDLASQMPNRKPSRHAQETINPASLSSVGCGDAPPPRSPHWHRDASERDPIPYNFMAHPRKHITIRDKLDSPLAGRARSLTMSQSLVASMLRAGLRSAFVASAVFLEILPRLAAERTPRCR